MRLLFFLCRTAVPHSFGIWTSSFGISNFFINRLVFQISATWISNFGFSNFSGHRWIFPISIIFQNFVFQNFVFFLLLQNFIEKSEAAGHSSTPTYLVCLCNLYFPPFILKIFCPSGTMHYTHNLRACDAGSTLIVHRP